MTKLTPMHSVIYSKVARLAERAEVRPDTAIGVFGHLLVAGDLARSDAQGLSLVSADIW